MYLKEVVLNGFKSFATRTRILLGPGVTTIVGPNGCGKSNIVDAIRWVLGEQSAKALRGGKMHDVIFEGTDKRKQLHFCEVSLIFTDCEAQLGTAFNEVEITRRVSRDGGSDYFLNGKRSRLKDIQNLFMDTGIGRVSYSFMMQGQIDQILSSNPVERRGIFEEAAGITRYKTQRKEALNKLALVDQNLSRAIDVMEEVGRRKASVQRQATKALRYKRIKHRLTHLDLAEQTYQYVQRKHRIEKLEAESKVLKQDVETASSSMAEEEAELESKKAARGELYESLQAVQQAVFDLRSEKDQAQNRADLAVIRGDDLKERVERMEAERLQLEEQSGRIHEKWTGSAEHREAQASEVGSSDGVFQAQARELNDAEKELQAAERSLMNRKQAIAGLERSIETNRSHVTTLEVDLKGFEVKRDNLKDGAAHAKSMLEDAQKELDVVLQAKEEQQGEKEEAETVLKKAQAEGSELKGVFKETQRAIQDQDRVVSRLSAQLRALEALQEKLEGFGDGAKAILSGDVGGMGDACSLLMQHVQAPEGYAPMLEKLLGPLTEAVIVPQDADLEALVEGLKSASVGQACLQIGARSNLWPLAKGMPSEIEAAADVVKSSEPDVDVFVKSALSGCYFAPSLDAFMSYWKAHEAFQFLLAVTADGALIDGRGFVYAGGELSENMEGSYLQRSSEILKLSETITEERSRLEKLTGEAEVLQNKMTAAEETVEAKREVLMELDQKLSQTLADERSLEARVRESRGRMERQEKELESLLGTVTAKTSMLDEARGKLDQAKEDLEHNKRGIDEEESAASNLREIREKKREMLAELRVELAEKKQRLEMLSQGLSQLEEERAHVDQRLAQIATELEDAAAQRVSLSDESGNMKARVLQLERELEAKHKQLETQRTDLMALEESMQILDEALSERRSERHDQEQSLSRVEVKLAEERSQSTFLLEKADNDYETDLSRVNWKRQLWMADEPFETRINLDELEGDEDIELTSKVDRGEPTDEDFDAMNDTNWGAIREEVKTLRSKIGSLGAVNLVAIEEYGELKERYTFLKGQTDDLLTAKEELVTAIDTINNTSKELFCETFEQVKKNFIYTFEKLFGGGEADLNLVDGEDVLDSGIDITARPPGTKLKSLTLLSGGQKTMTAVALLFAIYMVKPSPFCVLDELDAPLDDANIGRFTDILKQFTQYSQFLVISHNKRTISASDAIYGVTMQERGVTSLISMRFDHKTGRTEKIPSMGAAAPEQVVEVEKAEVISKAEVTV